MASHHSSQHATTPSYELLQTFFDTVEDWPGARCGHTLTAVFANNSHQLVLFGGSTTAFTADSSSLPEITLEGVTNSVHCFDVTTRKWTRANPCGEVPSPRAGHAATSTGTCLLIQGGIGPSGLSDGDVYMLDMSSNELKWHRLVLHGMAPGPRYGHVMGIAAKSWLVIFGGKNENEFIPGTWALDMQRAVAWERLNPLGIVPSGRMYASACARDDGFLVLCSGRDYSGTLGDAYGLKLDSNGQWCWILVPGVAPSPRCRHTAVIEGSRMHVIGGVLNRARLIDCDAVVAVLETQTGEWLDTNGGQDQTPTSGSSGQNHNQLIMRRYGHAAALVDTRIYVYGGLREDLLLDEFLMAETSQPPSSSEPEIPSCLRISSMESSLMERFGEDYNLPSLEAAFYDSDIEGLLQDRADGSEDEGWETDSTFSFTGQIPNEQDLHKTVISTLLRPGNWEPPASREFFLSFLEVKSLCRSGEQKFKQEPTVLQLQAPVKIFGDIHGQFADLMRLFREYGSPCMEGSGDITHIDYLFLGDYVDRGQHSLETIMLLIALKIEYPKNIHLIRGNHESSAVNGVHGFLLECKERMGEYDGFLAWKEINALFDHLPLAALIEKKVLCMHGGIGRTVSVDEIASIQRPCSLELIQSNMVLKDLLWSDPTENDSVMGIKQNPRGGDTISFGPDIVKAFCERNKLDMVIRAHECVMDGFERFAQGQLITVFSATNYCGKVNNAGAILVIGRDLVIYPKLIHPVPPPISSSEDSPDTACMQEEQNSERPPTPAGGEPTE